ncbi:MAG: hypothetical protein IJ333_04220 [Clostridia bacterium]|nr:hypothetical protein [Clostridia bacterium]
MKNEYIVDWPLLKQWTKESHYSGVRLAFFIGWCIFVFVFFVFSFLSIATLMYTSAVLFFTMALFCFYRAFIWNLMIAKQQYRRLAQTYGKDSWVRMIRFTEEAIVIEEENTKIQYNYSDVQEIIEKDEKIYLKVQAKTIIRLYKSKFVDCTWEDCKAKILEKNRNLNNYEQIR